MRGFNAVLTKPLFCTADEVTLARGTSVMIAQLADGRYVAMHASLSKPEPIAPGAWLEITDDEGPGLADPDEISALDRMIAEADAESTTPGA